MSSFDISEEKIKELSSLARKIRLSAVKMTSLGGSSHVGSVLSIADILAVLYGSELNVRPDDPSYPSRDRFILSKGHAGAGVYAALAATGFMPEKTLESHYQNGSNLSGHVSHKGVPGVEFSTGSLGHGLSVGCGMALAAKKDGKSHSVFVVMSDGECDEGSTWEAALFASHFKVSNLVAIIDRNGLQSIGSTEDTIALEPLSDKWRAFGWNVSSVDGHDVAKLVRCLRRARVESDRPSIIIANTTKGKGVSFMEDSVLWHYRSPMGDEFDAAVLELSGSNGSEG